MNLFKDKITVLNKYTIMGENFYLKTVLNGVLFDNCKRTNVKDYGTDNADTMMCYIPNKNYGKQYIDSIKFSSLTLDEKEKHWTLAQSDIIVLGDVDDTDISISTLRKKYQNVMVINSVDYLLHGGLAHWEVGGS